MSELRDQIEKLVEQEASDVMGLAQEAGYEGSGAEFSTCIADKLLNLINTEGQAGDVGKAFDAAEARFTKALPSAAYVDHQEVLSCYRIAMNQLRTALARSAPGWRPKPIEEWPKGEDSVVWAWYCAGPKNATRKEGGFWHPFYIDEDGVVCNAETWEPDPSLKSGHWKITHFILPNDIPSPLPAPPASNSEGS